MRRIDDHQINNYKRDREGRIRAEGGAVPAVGRSGPIDSGLDSLCFAVMVARLQDLLGVDPFSTGEDAPFPVTIGDFVKAYEDAVSNAAK